MRLAFIGGWGHHYLRGLLSEQADGVVARPVAVSGDGHDERRARALAQQLGEAAWFDDPRRMLEQFRPDVVSVGAVYGYNGDMIALAMERGAAVVSDKPIAATWEQFRRLKQLSERPGATLLTELPLRCLEEFQAAATAVADGQVGQVVLATAQKSYRFRMRPAWYADRASYGGTMLWVASHGIDAIRYLTGKSFSRVSATQGNVSRAEQGSMEEYCIATFDLAGGGAAVVHADYLRPNQLPTHSDDRIRIAGDRGIVEIRDSRCLLTDNDGTREITAQPRRVSRELLRALEGDTSLFSTADSLALAEILLHARDAADHRHPVELGVPAGAAGGDSPPGKVYDRQRLPKVQIPTTVRLPRAETERA